MKNLKAAIIGLLITMGDAPEPGCNFPFPAEKVEPKEQCRVTRAGVLNILYSKEPVPDLCKQLEDDKL